jgi:hypothetical protein
MSFMSGRFATDSAMTSAFISSEVVVTTTLIRDTPLLLLVALSRPLLATLAMMNRTGALGMAMRPGGSKEMEWAGANDSILMVDIRSAADEPFLNPLIVAQRALRRPGKLARGLGCGSGSDRGIGDPSNRIGNASWPSHQQPEEPGLDCFDRDMEQTSR